MSIRVKCSGCGKTIKGGDDWAGRKAKCPKCSTVVQFPDPVSFVSPTIASSPRQTFDPPPQQPPPISNSPTPEPPRTEPHSIPHSNPTDRHPTSCPSCNSSISPGVRWCRSCHSNVINFRVGRLAAPLRRLLAQLLDVLVGFGTLLLSLLLFLFLLFVLSGSAAIEKGISLDKLLSLFISLIPFGVYFVWALICYSNSTTPGKNLLGIRVVNEDGTNAGFFTMIVRDIIGKTISNWIFMIGFAWILFDPDYQGWHDKLMGTYVVE